MDDEFWGNLTENILQTWIVPELNRRQHSGKLPDEFVFYAGQIVMEPGAPLETRINEEVRGAIFLKTDSNLAPGEEMVVADFANVAADIARFDLDVTDRPNAAHVTIIQNAPGWFITFDLRYNAARIAEHLSAVAEFLDTAAVSLESRRLRAFVNDLFAAVELMAKARLLVQPDEELLRTKKHNYTLRHFNLITRRGNADQPYADLLNRLTALRNPARYPDGTFALSVEDGAAMLATATKMHEALRGVVPSRSLERLEAHPSRRPAN